MCGARQGVAALSALLLPLLSLLLLLLLLLLSVGGVQAQDSTVGTELSPEESRDQRAPVDYSDFQVLRVHVAGNETTELLQRYEDNPEFVLWSENAVLSGPVDVLVSPRVRRDLTDQLTRAGASYTVYLDNLQTAIEQENPLPLSTRIQVRHSLQHGHPLTWTAYHRLDKHHQFLDFVAQRRPELCQTFVIGTSSEGRDLKGIQCGRGAREIWLDGGMHAREWISPAVVSYLIQEFSERMLELDDIMAKFTIYMIPVLNPDGYEYSHTHDRMWRKTRSKIAGSECAGVDANRNFDIAWGKSGTSTSPCAATYGGPHPFSEPETRAIRDFVLRHKHRLEMFITFHSYSELLFVPYAFTVKKPNDYEEVRRVGQRGVDALQAVSGRRFDIPQTNKYNMISGVSDDWAKSVAGVKYTYTFELRDKGRHGFLLPSREIKSSGREMVAAVLAMIRALPEPSRSHSVGSWKHFGSGSRYRFGYGAGVGRRHRVGFRRQKGLGRRRF